MFVQFARITGQEFVKQYSKAAQQIARIGDVEPNRHMVFWRAETFWVTQ